MLCWGWGPKGYAVVLELRIMADLNQEIKASKMRL